MEKSLKQLLHDALLGGDGSITMTEFIQAFEAVVAQILKFEKKLLDKNTEVSDELSNSFVNFKKQLENSARKDINSFKPWDKLISAVKSNLCLALIVPAWEYLTSALAGA